MIKSDSRDWGDVSVVNSTGCSSENLGSISSTHVGVHNYLSFQFQRVLYPLVTSKDTRYIHGT